MALQVTSNQSQAILTIGATEDVQAALNDVSNAGGGIVYLLPGTYNLSANLSLGSNVTLEGTNRDAVILDFGGGGYSVQMIGTEDTTHEGAQIRTLTIQNSTAPGIDALWSNDFVIYNINVYECSVGIRVVSSEYPTIEFPFLEGNGVGMDLTDCTGYLLQGGVFNDSTAGAGLALLRSGDATVFNSEFNGNAADGISMEETEGFTMFSCTVRDNNGNGISITDGSSIQISWVDIGANGGDGIELTANVDGAQIGSNTITGNTAWGIDVAAASDTSVLIPGNQISGNTVGQVNHPGTDTLIRSNIGAADSA